MAIEFRHARLSNGMNVVAEVDPAAHTSAIGFFVKTGARDEAHPLMGVSHFLEHMMFKGTAKRTAEDVDRAFDDIGADHNAFTSLEMTAFHAHMLPEHFITGLDVLADLMRPALRQEDFDSEKKVILEEIAMYDDHPFWVLYEQAMEAYYGRSTLAHRVLGTNETITRLTRDEMQAYFDNRYSADTTVVSLAGKIDFERVVGELESRCGGWKRTDAARCYERPAVQRARLTRSRETINRHYMLMMCPGPGMDDDRRYATAVLAQILGDDEGSRLYWALVETGIADAAQAQADSKDRIGEQLVFCTCDPERAEEVEAVVMKEIAGLADSLTEDDLARVRSKIATGATLSGELPAGRMKRLGRVWTYHGVYRSLEEELARINRVTLKELREAIETFPLEPYVVAHLTPGAAHVKA